MVTSFPFANGLIETCFEVFRGSSKTLLQFVPLIFIGRIILIKMTFGSSQDYRDLLKELVFLYVGFFIFQEVMEFVMSTPEMAASIIKKPEPVNIENKSSWFSSLWDFDLMDMVNMVSSLIYWFVCFCYLILMGFMVTVGAYIILFSSLLRMKWMIKAYMSLVLILSMWPFVWYTVDQTFIFVIKGLENSNSGTAVLVAKLISGVLKMFVPVLGLFAAMKAPVAGVIGAFNSLREGARPITGGARLAQSGTKKVGKAFGVDTAIESFRGDPEAKEARRQEKIKNRKFELRDTAPMAAYGVRRALNKLPDSNQKTRDAYGTTQTEKKKMGFQEFKESNVVSLEKRRSIKAQNKMKVNSNSTQSMNSKVSSSNSMSTRSDHHQNTTTTQKENHQIKSQRQTKFTEQKLREKSVKKKVHQTDHFIEKKREKIRNDIRGEK